MTVDVSITSFGSILLGCPCGYGTDQWINVAFLSAFLLAAFQFFRLKPSAVSMHSVASAALVGYAILKGMLWLIPGSIGTSIAAASGVENIGIAPLLLWSGVPALYPVASTIVLQCAATDAMEVSAPTEIVDVNMIEMKS